MPCKIETIFDGCNTAIADYIIKASVKLAGIECLDMVYPIVQTAVRNSNKRKIRYPRLEYKETDGTVAVIDLFPGARLDHSYAFIERLSEINFDTTTDYINYTLGVVFWITKDCELNNSMLSKVEADAYNAVKYLTGTNNVKIEDRINQVWSEYGYELEDFGQFQHPHSTFKLIIEAQSYYSCACPGEQTCEELQSTLIDEIKAKLFILT